MIQIKNSLIYIIFLVFMAILILNIDTLMINTYNFVSYDLFDPYFDMMMGLIWFILFSLIISKTMEKEYLIIWLIKAFVTLIIMLPYEAHYKLDAYVYFSAAIDINNTSISGNSTLYMAYLNHYLSYILGESYQSLKLFHSFIGFLGLVLLFKSFEIILKESGVKLNQLYIYFFFLFPTILFWSSILGKDPINLFVIGLIFYSIINMIKTFEFKYLIIFCLMIIGIYFIRYWYVGILLLTVVMYLSYINIFKKNWYLFISFAILLSIIVSSMDNIYSQIILDKLNSFSNNFSFGGSRTDTYDYTTLSDFFYYFIPNLFTTLFRPMLFDITNAFTFISACENIVLFLLVVKYIVLNIKDLVKNKYIVFLLFYIFSWLLFYVLVSPGNLGTAIRFKLQVLPIILIVIGYSIHMKISIKVV